MSQNEIVIWCGIFVEPLFRSSSEIYLARTTDNLIFILSPKDIYFVVFSTCLMFITLSLSHTRYLAPAARLCRTYLAGNRIHIARLEVLDQVRMWERAIWLHLPSKYTVHGYTDRQPGDMLCSVLLAEMAIDSRFSWEPFSKTKFLKYLAIGKKNICLWVVYWPFAS